MILSPKTKTRIHKNDWKEKPRAFIILGLEGSGTYMLHNALVKAKCVPLAYEGRDQIIDTFGFDISIRQSFPHAGEWPDCDSLEYKCRRAGYFTFLIWIIREPHAQIQSVWNRDKERRIQDLHEHQAKYYKDLGSMCDYYGIVITYEAFCTSEGFRRWLFEERLQLPYPEDFEVYDGNKKYYE